MRIHKIENVNFSLKFIAENGIKLVGIGAEDIVDQKLKLILGLIWTLILRYKIAKSKEKEISILQINNALLEWVQRKIPQHNVQNFTSDWQSGLAIYDLVNAVEPGTLPDKPESKNALVNCTRAFDAACLQLEIPKLLDPQDMVEFPDKNSNMTYISYYRDYDCRARIVTHTIPPADLTPRYSIGFALCNQLGEYIRVDWELPKEFKPKDTDYVCLTECNRSDIYLIKTEASGEHNGCGFLDCTDYEERIDKKPVKILYCQADGTVILAKDFVYEIVEYVLVAKLNGLTLEVTFNENGEIVEETSVYEHPEFFMDGDDDDQGDYDDDQDDFGNDDYECVDPGDSRIRLKFIRADNLLEARYSLDRCVSVSRRDYVTISIDGSDINEMEIMMDADGKRKGTAQFYCDGYEKSLRRKYVVARYFNKNGAFVVESDPVEYKRPRN